MSEPQLKNHQQTQSNFDTNNQFDSALLLDAFSKSISEFKDEICELNDIFIKEYIIAYEEMIKFLELLGPVFYFVIIDIKDKINILKKLLNEFPENYSSLLSIVKHEKKSDFYISQSNREQYGARTVLRLHRGLIFMFKFLDQLFKAESSYKSAQICSKVYESTFAKHHPWLIRKAVGFAAYAMPAREVLLGYICKTHEEFERFPVFINKVEQVYKITQEIYEKFEILDLP